MNEVTKIPWGKVFSNFAWILGASIILAVFSYHEFLAYVQKAKRIEVFKRNSFKKPFLFGLILVTAGVCASIHQPWLAAILGVVVFLLIIWFVKIVKIQSSRNSKTKIENIEI